MTEGAHLSDIELAGFVDNRLNPAARRLAVAHLDSCAECRAELIATAELVSRHHSPAVTRSTRWAVAAGLAMAAGLAGIFLYRGPLGLDAPATTVRTPVVSSADAQPRISTVNPRDGATLQTAEHRFTWHAYEADNYRFLLLGEDGTPLWTADTHDTSIVLPAEVPLTGGRTYFWRVDAHADGITASTGTMRLQVAR
jgi:hypothetical protein